VELSVDGTTWTVAAETAAQQENVTFSFNGNARVRVVPRMSTVDENDCIGSDVYRLAAGAELVVVDGFDRVVDGSYGGLTHDFAAIVGQSVGAVATVSNEALLEDGFSLDPWATTIWLLGDEARDDHAFSPSEQAVVSSYLTGGGTLIVSGSEVAYDLDNNDDGVDFLQDVFGAQYAGDDSGSYTVSGLGPLAALGSFSYAGPASPYEEDYPDWLSTTGLGVALLQYGTSTIAGVGISGQAALLGFPVELIDDEAKRQALLGALLDFVNPTP